MVRQTYTRPNCTHISMDMVHLSALCDVCHQQSSLGWVYECQQDRIQQLGIAEKEARSTIEHNNSLIGSLIALGFSQSVIRQASEGQYTESQIELLKNQKSYANKIIALQTLFSGDRTDESIEAEPLHPNITIRRKKAVPFKKTDASRSNVRGNAKCNLRCCHVRTENIMSKLSSQLTPS
jgi:hypothetical protein